MSGAPSLFDNLGDIKSRHPKVFESGWRSRLTVLLVISALLGLFVYGLGVLEFSFLRIWNGIGKLGVIVGLMMPPDPETMARLIMYGLSLAETLAIAFLGTGLACVLAFPLALLAARNVMTQRIVQFLTRRSLDVVRGVDTLIWALIWINVVGLGPFAGVLAIMSADIGAFGKLFSEALEAASGGSHAQSVRFGLIPQVLPIITSQWLYYIESNTRSATIIGIVGAGGIGLHLSEMIRTLEWQQVSFLVLMILATVALIDALSSKIRFAIIGPRAL